MPYMSLLMLMYFADREALIRWAVPITNDAYYSLDHGPILSRLKDLIVEQQRSRTFWTQHISVPQNFEIVLVANPGDDQLSTAEERLIDEVYEQNKLFNQWELSKISHDLPEWQDPHGTSKPITIEDILKAGGIRRKKRETMKRELEGLRRMQSLSAD